MDAEFICRRCGKTYAIDEYLKNRFCIGCGTLLAKISAYKMLQGKTRKPDEANFNRLVKEFFPYSYFRPFQLDATRFVYETMSKGKIGLLSSPCGTGKSIAVLTAFFAAREVNPSLGRLIVLTRTTNQLEIYSRELKNIKDHCDINFVASIFKSKREMCPHFFENSKIKDISYRDFLYYCKGLKDGVFGNSCEYYNRTYQARKPSWQAYNVLDRIKKIGPILPDEVFELCREEKICPYEVTRILTSYADIVVGNYNYVLVDAIRGSILGRAGIGVKEINCVFDEAHSLPYYAATMFSDELSSKSVIRAKKEVEKFEVDDFEFLEALHQVMIEFGKKVYRNYGFEMEHVVEGESLIYALSKKLRISRDKLIKALGELADKGELVRYKKSQMGKIPVSYLSRCTDFLSNWINLQSSSYVRYVKVEEDVGEKKLVRLGIRCLDPALAASVINKLRSAILMSGTLWNREYYMDVLGIERGRCQFLELPNPFPSRNRLIVVDKAVTTKFEKRDEIQWKRISNHLNQIIMKIRGRIAVYFPSYDTMQIIVSLLKHELPTLVEDERTKISDVLKFLNENDNCVVFGVARGKISEGVDMSVQGRSMLSAVINVGLPFPKKTELQTMLYEYFREKFGSKAMEYANDIPCLNALAQSSGRLLRSPEDKGIIIIMDGRTVGKFKRMLPKEWRNELKAHYRIEKNSFKDRGIYGIKICIKPVESYLRKVFTASH